MKERPMTNDPRRRSWILETIGLAAGLAILGALGRPGDPGFTELNPSPYLLLPLLFGAQYGVAAGIGSAVAAALARAAAILVAAHGVAAIPWAAMLGERMSGVTSGGGLTALLAGPAADRELWVGLLLAGAVAGEFREQLGRESARLRQVGDAARAQVDVLTRECLLLKETKSTLEQRLAEVTDSQSTVFDEAARLLTLDAHGAHAGVLRLLNKYAGVEEAALYRFEDGALRLVEQFGTEEKLPPVLVPDEEPIVEAALAASSTVTVRELGPGAGAGDPAAAGGWTARRVLIATPLVAPLSAAQRTPLGMVVVYAIPFIRMSEATVRLVSLIADWGGRVIHDLEATDEVVKSGLFDPLLQAYRTEYLREKLADEFRRSRRFGLSASLITLAPALEGASDDKAEGLRWLLLATARESCRPGDVMGVTDHERPHAVLLLPMTDRRAAGERLHLIEALWGGRVREQMRGEDLPPLKCLELSTSDQPDASTAWEAVETWVRAHA